MIMHTSIQMQKWKTDEFEIDKGVKAGRLSATLFNIALEHVTKKRKENQLTVRRNHEPSKLGEQDSEENKTTESGRWSDNKYNELGPGRREYKQQTTIKVVRCKQQSKI